MLGLSGGKDSAALAIYLRDRIPQMEYFFCDTGRELPETYEYLQRLETILGKRIEHLNADRDFDHWLEIFGGTLPSPQMRWCTKNLKIKPLEKWIGDAPTYSYVGIRADEDRGGYESRRSNIIPVFPFKDDGLVKADVVRILEEAGVGMPDYYRWRTRSGCFFCFFQRKIEWVRLADEHPDLFERAVEYEDKVAHQHRAGGSSFTWSQGETLRELIARREQIELHHQMVLARGSAVGPNRPLIDVLDDILEAEDPSGFCAPCHL